ncbi:MAG: hypothetical protein PUF08_06095 [Clostridiales bacterium]|nr:hypothetical protein [Clostridiales bacterium]
MMKNYISPEMKISLFNLERVATGEPAVTVNPMSTNQLPTTVEGVTGTNTVLKSYNINKAIELK